MRRGSIIGYDLNENTCQISYYDEKSDEPQTFEYAQGQSLIPLKLGYIKEQWVYGKEAELLEQKLASGNSIITLDMVKSVIDQNDYPHLSPRNT